MSHLSTRVHSIAAAQAPLIVLLLLITLSGCARSIDEAKQQALQEIVFGSCLDRTEHPMLDRTLTLPMDLFIFTGDNVYADTMDMSVMRQDYDRLKHSRFFRGVRDKAPVLATWDDHDYGVNDGGAD